MSNSRLLEFTALSSVSVIPRLPSETVGCDVVCMFTKDGSIGSYASSLMNVQNL